MPISRWLPSLIVLTAIQYGCSNPAAESTPDEVAAASLLFHGSGFHGIGDLPGGDFYSEALAISDDGGTVVGRSSSPLFFDEGFIRTSLDTMLVLLRSGGAHTSGEPRGINPTGDIVAGKIAPAGSPIAARWTAAEGWVGLPDIPGGANASQALGISADGRVLVGWGSSSLGNLAARWVDGVVVSMGDLSGGANNSAAALVSHDGTIVVGTGTSAQGPQVFRWKSETGLVGLGDIPGGAFSSEPFGMTPDAAVIVGEATSASGIEAFRWTATGGMEGLGDLPGGAFQSMAFDVSANGAVVVGFGTTNAGAEAFIWERSAGMRRLEDVLIGLGLEHVSAWQLTDATGISADGRVIIGNGVNPNAETEGWIARLPGNGRPARGVRPTF